jgi:hypothetical protein
MASSDPPGAAAIGARATDDRGAAVTGPGAADDPVPGWLRAASAGDAQAWNRLVDRHAGLVWSICRAHRMSEQDAADV